jgi:hypothetical protein
MIRVEVTFTEADYLRVIRFTTSRQTTTFTMMLALGAVILALLLYRADPEGFHWWAMPAIAGLLLLFIYLIRFTQRFNIARQLKSVPAINEPYIYTFTENELAIAGRLSSTNIKWEAIVKVRESKTDFLFYTTKSFAQFLPKRAFEDTEEMNELRVLLTRNLGDRAQLLA